MKRILTVWKTSFSLMLALGIISCKSDDSHRETGEAGDLLREGRQWSRSEFVEGADCYYANTRVEWIDGDTVIGGKVWCKLYFSEDEESAGGRPGGLFRQEGQKLYRLWSDKELLLFDFGKVAGEQLKLFMDAENYENLTVARVFDTVLPGGDGVALKAMQLEDEQGYVQDVWVEGIGSLSAGLQGSVFPPGIQVRQVLCVKDEANWIYQNPNFQTCFLDGEVDKEVLWMP